MPPSTEISRSTSLRMRCLMARPSASMALFAWRRVDTFASSPRSPGRRNFATYNKGPARDLLGRRSMNANAAAVLTKPAFRKIEWLKRDIAVQRRDDGVIVLKSRIPLKRYDKDIPASLTKWASTAPERVWLAQRTGNDRQWSRVSYGSAKATVDALTQGLLNLKLEPGRPVAILSGNSIEHALMAMASMQARFPVAPVSPAYSLMS